MNTASVSVVIATHNRLDSLRTLLGDLSRQTIRKTDYEVIVVDDASPHPVPASVRGALLPGRFTLLRVPRGGPGAARNAGAAVAVGAVLIFVDDDMRVGPDFIERHLEQFRPHLPPLVVLGNIQASHELEHMPLFERYHARQLARFQNGAIAGTIRPRGVHLCTGNVAMRRVDFADVGGFDAALSRSEDRELGIRLERRGCRFVFGQYAVSQHGSDHRDPTVWRRRNELYGRADLIIARKHPAARDIHPWRFWSLIPAYGRPLAFVTLLAPRLGQTLASAVYGMARCLDRMGAHQSAVALTGLTYCLDYFRGLRHEAGSFAATRPSSSDAADAPSPVLRLRPSTAASESAPQAPSAWRDFRAAVRADYDTMRLHRQKYHGGDVPSGGLVGSLITKVGLQLLVAYRLMRLFDAWRVPLAPQIISRLIRHLYGAEIHWKTRIGAGVSVVHGVGLVLSHRAEVASGCILFQGVTLGESIDPASGITGAPRLDTGVHVGPGATILGPIHVGAHSKVMAGAVLTQDVPARSLVCAPTPLITPRAQRRPALTASLAV